jgi:hypothetical protein
MVTLKNERFKIPNVKIFGVVFIVRRAAPQLQKQKRLVRERGWMRS